MKWLSYLDTVDSLIFEPVSCETWETIIDEGLDDETCMFYRKSWYQATLEISEDDSKKLITLDPDTLNKFNEFDIELKNKYSMKIIDLIDYTSGTVILVKYK